MSRLLISMLGGAPPGEAREGQAEYRFRLPGGDRIVQTSHLGIELARALQVRKLVLAGTASAYFDHLTELLSEADQLAVVEEQAPEETVQADDLSGEASEPDDRTTLDEDDGSDTLPEAGANPGTEAAPDGVPPGPTASASPDEALPPAPGEDAPVASATAPAEEPDVETAETAETSATGDVTAEADLELQDAGPEVTATRTPRVPLKHHEQDPRPLRQRLADQACSGQADRAALDALAERLGRTLGLEMVACILISSPTDDRSFQSSLRNLVEIPAAGDEVFLDLTYGERGRSLLGFLAMYYLQRFRPEVRTGDVLQGAPEHSDRDGIAPIVSLSAPFGLLRWMHAMEDVAAGHPSPLLHGILGEDRRLQALAGPYVRYQRGLQFGSSSEVQAGARLFEEKRRRLHRLPYSHPYRLFDAVLRRALQSFSKDAPASETQLELATRALSIGRPAEASMHLREALLCATMEVYELNPHRSWMPVPDSGGAQEVRVRDVAGFVLGSPRAHAVVKDLDLIWPLLSNARGRYSNVTASPVPATQLKAYDHEITRLHGLTRDVLASGALRVLAEALPHADVIKEAIDLRLIRPSEPRRAGRRRGGPPAAGARRGSPRREDSVEPGSGEGHGPREGGSRPPRGPRGPGGPGGPRGDRYPREERGPGRAGDQRGGDRRGPPRPSHPSAEETDARPRVEAVRGLGNLGLALKKAGLSDEHEPPDSGRPAAPGAPTPEPAPRPQAAAVPPAPKEPPEPPERQAPEPPASAPPAARAPAAEPADQAGLPAPDFDVAGPPDEPQP